MPNKNTKTYRKILDTGDITAAAVSALLVEKLGKNLEKNEMSNLVRTTEALIKTKSSELVDSLQKLEA